MTADKPERIVAAQLRATRERVARWDKVAEIMGMNRAEFLRYAADSTCDRIESQTAELPSDNME